jgi:transcriptional regulator with XRE-family HTH domain
MAALMSEQGHTQETVQPFDVGPRLFALRQERGLSQRELARMAGVTNANLSMIEQGRVSPSVTTLEKILNALELSLPEFFVRTGHTTADIFPREQLIHLKRDGSEYWILPPPSDSQIPQLAQQTMPPGSTIVGTWMGRRCWISGLVQAGELSLWLDGHRHLLRPGEGFRFHLRRSHQFANDTQDFLVMILALSEGEGAG